MAYGQAFNPYAANMYGGYQAAYAPPQGWQGSTQQAAPQSNPQQMMTPPTIRAEIVQADSLAAIDRYPMAAGTSQMYMTKDEAYIVIRSMLANGEHTDAVYEKRPPAPPEPVLNPSDYVRRDEIAALIAEAMKKAGKEEE